MIHPLEQLRADLDLAEMLGICRAQIIEITGIREIADIMSISNLKAAFNDAAKPNFVATGITMVLERDAQNPALQWQVLKITGNGPAGKFEHTERVAPGADPVIGARTAAHKLVAGGA